MVSAASAGERLDLADGAVVRVERMRRAEFAGDLHLAAVSVDSDDGIGAAHDRAHDDVQAHAARAIHGHALARAHIGGVHRRANAGRYRAAHQRRHFQRHIVTYWHRGRLVDHHVFGEAAEPGHDVYRLVIAGDAAGAILHQARSQHRREFFAEVALVALAIIALAAIGAEAQGYVIARLKSRYAFADAFHHARAFVAADDGQREIRMPFDHMPIAVADAGRRDLNQNFARLRWRQIDRFYAEWRIEFVEDCRLHFHNVVLLRVCAGEPKIARTHIRDNCRAFSPLMPRRGGQGVSLTYITIIPRARRPLNKSA